MKTYSAHTKKYNLQNIPENWPFYFTINRQVSIKELSHEIFCLFVDGAVLQYTDL